MKNLIIGAFLMCALSLFGATTTYVGKFIGDGAGLSNAGAASAQSPLTVNVNGAGHSISNVANLSITGTFSGDGSGLTNVQGSTTSATFTNISFSFVDTNSIIISSNTLTPTVNGVYRWTTISAGFGPFFQQITNSATTKGTNQIYLSADAGVWVLGNSTNDGASVEQFVFNSASPRTPTISPLTSLVTGNTNGCGFSMFGPVYGVSNNAAILSPQIQGLSQDLFGNWYFNTQPQSDLGKLVNVTQNGKTIALIATEAGAATVGKFRTVGNQSSSNHNAFNIFRFEGGGFQSNGVPIPIGDIAGGRAQIFTGKAFQDAAAAWHTWMIFEIGAAADATTNDADSTFANVMSLSDYSTMLVGSLKNVSDSFYTNNIGFARFQIRNFGTNRPTMFIEPSSPYIGALTNGQIWEEATTTGTNLVIVGNVAITGTNIGNGSGLTNLNGASISPGTLQPISLPSDLGTNTTQEGATIYGTAGKTNWTSFTSLADSRTNTGSGNSEVINGTGYAVNSSNLVTQVKYGLVSTGAVLSATGAGLSPYIALPTNGPVVSSVGFSILSGSFNGSGANLSSLPAAQLTGTLPLSVLPVTVATNYSVVAFGATGGADDTVAFQNAINAAALAGGGTVTIPPNILYTISNLQLSNKVVFGNAGDIAYLKMKIGASNNCIDTFQATNWGIRNLCIDGSARSVDGSGFTTSYVWPNIETETAPFFISQRTGVRVWTGGAPGGGPGNQAFVNNVYCIGFTNGFYGLNTNKQGSNLSVVVGPHLIIQNCHASQCYVGWNFTSFSSPIAGVSGNFPEYVTFVNCSADLCAYGGYMTAGNESWIGGEFTENQFDLTAQQGQNVGHSVFTGTRFNHANQYAVWLDLQALGYIFNGCYFLGIQSAMPNILLTGDAGVQFNGCEFDGSSSSPKTTITSSTNSSAGSGLTYTGGVNRIWNSTYRGNAANFIITNDNSLSINMDSATVTNDFIRNNWNIFANTATVTLNTNTYAQQIVIKNTSTGGSASSELSIQGDNGTPTDFFFSMGMNNSSFTNQTLFPILTNAAWLLVMNNSSNYARASNTSTLMIDLPQTNSSVNFSVGNGGSKTNVQISDSGITLLGTNQYNGSGAGLTSLNATNITGLSSNGTVFVAVAYVVNVLYTNTLSNGIVTCGVQSAPTTALAAGNVSLSFTNSGSVYPVFSQTTVSLIGSPSGAMTNALSSQFVPAGGIYGWLDTSAGAGNSCGLTTNHSGYQYVSQQVANGSQNALVTNSAATQIVSGIVNLTNTGNTISGNGGGLTNVSTSFRQSFSIGNTVLPAAIAELGSLIYGWKAANGTTLRVAVSDVTLWSQAVIQNQSLTNLFVDIWFYSTNAMTQASGTMRVDVNYGTNVLASGASVSITTISSNNISFSTSAGTNTALLTVPFNIPLAAGTNLAAIQASIFTQISTANTNIFIIPRSVIRMQ